MRRKLRRAMLSIPQQLLLRSLRDAGADGMALSETYAPGRMLIELGLARSAETAAQVVAMPAFHVLVITSDGLEALDSD